MYKNKSVSVYFICQNNEHEVENIKDMMPECVDEVIVVCNQSLDNSYQRSIQLGFTTYRDDRLLDGYGSGFAHMTALENATTDIIVSCNIHTLDRLKDISTLLDYFIEHNSDMVSFNRNIEECGNVLSRAIDFLIRIETQLLYGIVIEDILSDIWAVNSLIVRQLELTVGDNNIISQIKINAAMHPQIQYNEFKMAAQDTTSRKRRKISVRTRFKKMYWIAHNFFNTQNESFRQ